MSTLQLASPLIAEERFPCFGGACSVLVEGAGPAGPPQAAAAGVRRRLEAWHHQFSRFEADSELSRLNADPRPVVPVSALMARFIESALHAAELTGGLVDPTLIAPLERAGYTGELARPAAGAPRVQRMLAGAGALRPARRAAEPAWRRVSVDRTGSTVTRPPGLRLDPGGIVKGLFGDVLAGLLNGHESFVVNAAGDLRWGGRGGRLRPVQVQAPEADEVLHAFHLRAGAAATSGIVRRWIGRDGRPRHHLLDPATGEPAYTGIVQATALAPTGLEAEARAKAALLSGPSGAAKWLRHGGLVVLHDGSHQVVASTGALA